MQLSYVRVLVDRYAECFRFYRDVMGFELLMGDENSRYAEFRTGGQTRLAITARSILAVVPGVSAEAGASTPEHLMLVFQVADVDAEAAALKRRGAQLIAEPVDRPEWTVRTAHLRDPEGNLIEVNTPLER